MNLISVHPLPVFQNRSRRWKLSLRRFSVDLSVKNNDFLEEFVKNYILIKWILTKWDQPFFSQARAARQ